MTDRAADEEEALLEAVRFAKHHDDLIFGAHSLRRMSERHITVQQIEDSLNSSEAMLLADYPDDSRPAVGYSPSCLVLGWDDQGDPVHVQVAYAAMWIVTTYRPDPDRWVTPWERDNNDRT